MSSEIRNGRGRPVLVFGALMGCLAGAADVRAQTVQRPVMRLEGLSAILDAQARSAFAAVSNYLEKNPQAPDAERGYHWLFETARRHGFEGDAVELARAYLDRDESEDDTAALAREVKTIGLARAGKMDDAMAAFDEQIRTVSLRAANDAVDLGVSLANAAQLAEDAGAVRAVYERLSERFFLNPSVRSYCDNKLAKLGLVGEAAPEIGVPDLEGTKLDLTDYRGKLVLVDFWATNCPPCLEEFPGLKQLYAEYHDRGFEVLGLSLDEETEAIDEFQKKWKLPWRLALAEADGQKTRPGWKVETIPSMFLVDGEGKVVAFDLRGMDLRRAVEQRLGTAGTGKSDSE